jgi:hypothetical protein
MAGGPNDGVNVVAGTSRPGVAVEKACRRITTLCMGKNKMKIFEGLSKSKNMVFNLKKLLNVAVDLTAKG